MISAKGKGSFLCGMRDSGPCSFLYLLHMPLTVRVAWVRGGSVKPMVTCTLRTPASTFRALCGSGHCLPLPFMRTRIQGTAPASRKFSLCSSSAEQQECCMVRTGGVSHSLHHLVHQVQLEPLSVR